MRVTEQQIFAALTGAVARGWERLARVQEQIASGVRVSRPSGDPAAAGRIGTLDEALRRLDVAEKGAATARARLERTEAALAEANGVFIRARQLAVQGASEQYGAEERAALADEVVALREHLLSLANTEVGGRYLFSGALTDRPAFDAAGNYQGDSNEPSVEVSPGVKVASVMSGDRVFGAAGGTDTFAVLSSLEAALRSDDTAGIQASLDAIDAASEQLVAVRAEAGARLELVGASSSWNLRLREGILDERSETRDTDVAEATMQLALAQKTLEAAVATVAKMTQPDLLDRL